MLYYCIVYKTVYLIILWQSIYKSLNSRRRLPPWIFEILGLGGVLWWNPVISSNTLKWVQSLVPRTALTVIWFVRFLVEIYGFSGIQFDSDYSSIKRWVRFTDFPDQEFSPKLPHMILEGFAGIAFRKSQGLHPDLLSVIFAPKSCFLGDDFFLR